LRSCRACDIGLGKDGLRLESCGKVGVVNKVDLRDNTVCVDVAEVGSVWFGVRALGTTIADVEVGKSMRVKNNKQLILQSCRHVGIANDSRRLEALGMCGVVMHVDAEDATVLLQIEPLGPFWFAEMALEKV